MTSFSKGNALALDNYLLILRERYYLKALFNSIWLSLAVTVVSLVISGVLAFFLARTHFPGKSLYFSLITFPISFPGVVVGFMIIILFGTTGVIPMLTQKLFKIKVLSISYTIMGIFLSYLYFQIPRLLMTLYGTISEIDRFLEDAARTLGATPFQAIRYVILPNIMPIFISAGTLAFSTSMSAFGTAFTLANQFNILPIVMYSEFTLSFNVGVASAIAIIIGAICIVMNYAYQQIIKGWGL
jgi:putative spermidine/putrescine transport system permease protein